MEPLSNQLVRDDYFLANSTTQVSMEPSTATLAGITFPQEP